MSNIAIIIGVSNYLNPSANLPGCQKDTQIMKTLLDSTNKYSEIIVLDQETDSTNVKEKLSEFIANHNKNDIDEVFFYYTGHGGFFDNEFCYLFSDFDKSKRRQTSLSNSEVDNLIRQLKPNLAIKVIDACYSGVTYIKDQDLINKYLNESKEKFNKCYFFFSSLFNQTSYQTVEISDFTKTFIEAIIQYHSSEIRYKDLMDYISDDFENKSIQTPFFVIQADFTEVFCSVTPTIKKNLAFQLDFSSPEENKPIKETALSLKELVEKEAQFYCSKEDAIKKIVELKKHILKYKYCSEITSLYDISCEFKDNYDDSLDLSFISKWLVELEDIKDFFVESSKKKMPFGEYYQRLKLTTDVPFKQVTIEAKNKYPNIPPCYCVILFVLSKTSIRFFYFYSQYKEVDWGQYEPGNDFQWFSRQTKLKNDSWIEPVNFTGSLILKGFESFVIEPIKARFNLDSNQQEVEDEDADEEDEDTDEEDENADEK
ncbi:caspase family protein [Trichocoleus sp. ST-U3]